MTRIGFHNYHGKVLLHSDKSRAVLLPMMPTLKALSNYIAGVLDRSWIMSPEDIREVIVLKGKRKPKIHGYYDWIDGKLRLDKSKPADLHNIFYGLGD